MGRIFSDFAQVKIFLTADSKVRAHRRWLELQKNGDKTREEEILAQILERDHRDTTREISPLSRSPDAYEIDTSDITIPEQVEKIYEIVQEVLQKPENLS
jgi:cytidylate kinase